MGTTKETFKHAAIYSFSAVLGRMISFFMLPFYAHILRGIGYGVIGMIDAGLSFLMSIFTYGVRGSITRFYHEEEGENKNRVVSTGVLLYGGASLVLVCLGMLGSRPVSQLLLGDGGKYYLLCLALATFFFELTGQAASAILLIQRRSVKYSVINLLRLFVGLALNIYLIIILRWGLVGYFLSALITGAASAVWFYAIAIRECGLRFDRRIARKLIAFQLPLLPGSLASFFSRQIERVIIRFQINLEAVGVLEIGYKFPVLLGLLISEPFMRSWNTKRTEIADQPGAPERIGKVFTYYLFLVFGAGLVMAVCIRDVIEILTPPEFWLAYRIARIEVLTFILMGSYYHLHFGLYYAKDTKTMSVVRATTAGLKVALSFVFISLWGIFGAAYSACLVAAVTLVWTAVLAQRRYPLLIEYRKIFAIVATAGAFFVVLTQVDLQDLGLVKTLREGTVPAVADFLDGTALGDWKAGKAILLLRERAGLIADLLVKAVFCLGFGVLFPLVHEETRDRLDRWLRTRMGG